MKKYIVEIPDQVIECDSWRAAVLVAKINQPSWIFRGSYCITQFPFSGAKVVEQSSSER